MLHSGITPLGNDPGWFKITRFYPEMCLNGVNTQWVFSLGVVQQPLDVFVVWLQPTRKSLAVTRL